ncbi:hypothetical protein [Burkholderia ambifaria]|uniref:hypothetical protein n=1 Tax=Burkholderia ambifaria TaxID=152480 RepID=UPI00339B05E0
MDLSFARSLMSSAVRHEGGRPVVSESLREVEQCSEVAFLAQRLLGGECFWSLVGKRSSRIELAERSGYAVAGRVDYRRLADDLVSRLGTQYFGAVTSKQDFSAELVRAVSLQDDKICTPIYALLVAYLLIDVSARSTTVGEPDCPGSRADQDENHQVTTWGNPNRGAHYLCTCGLSFVLRPSESGISLTQEGQDVALAVALLVAKSYSDQTIASMLGLSQHVIERLVARRVVPRQWMRRTERAKRLAQWIDLVRCYGGADKAYAHRAHIFHSLGKLVEILPDTVVPKNTRIFDDERRVRGER